MTRKTTKATRRRQHFLNDPHVLILLPRIHAMINHNGKISLVRPDGESMQCSWAKLEKALVKFYDDNY